MRQFFYLLLFATQVFYAQNGFENGNALYRKGDYAGAVSAYENVLKSKKESAELYFNLGNAYYKLNKVAPAIYNYEKALLLHPGDTEIRNNLQFAHKMQIDEVKNMERVGFSKMIRDFTQNFHYDSWAWLAIGGAFLFLLLFVAYYFSHTTVLKRLLFFAMFLTLLWIVLSVFAAIYEKNSYETERPAIVFAGITGVKSEPEKNAADAFVLHEGAKVYVLESLDNWRKIQLPDGTEGWIEKDAIKELK